MPFYLMILLGVMTLCLPLFAQDQAMSWTPLIELPTTRTLNVTDFGAIPDDGQNDQPAIQACFNEAASSSEPVKILFPKGVYHLGTSVDHAKPSRALRLVKASQVHIDGQGATLLITNPSLGLMAIEQSQKIIIERLEIDYQTLPWISGKIIHINPRTGSFDLKLDENQRWPKDPVAFLTQTRSRWGSWGYLQDQHIPGRLKMGVNNHYFIKSIKQLNPQNLRLELPDKTKHLLVRDFALGDVYTHVVRQVGHGFFFKKCSDITARNISIHALIGAPFVGVASQRTAILNNKLLITPGRRQVASADFAHFQSPRIGPWIEGNTVEGVADDTVNLYTRGFFVTGIADHKTLLLKAYLRGLIQVDDVMVFQDPLTLQTLWTSKVVKINHSPRGIVFAKAIPPKLHSRITELHLYDQSIMPHDFLIKDNTFRNSRRYGVVLRGFNGKVENNTFEGLSAEAIIILNQPVYPEGLFMKNLIVRNNRILGCGFELGGRASAITVYSRNDRTEKKPCPAKGHGNLLLTDNLIEVTDFPAVNFDNIDGITFTGNRFVLPRGLRGTPQGTMIKIGKYVDNLICKDNQFPDHLPENQKIN